MHVDAIRAVIRRAPFIPFLLRMNDGRVFNVPHPDYLAVSRRFVIFIDPETDAPIWLEPILIASLEFAEPPQSAPEDGTGGNK
jgi:hypothetical protein